jgi:hypothetical protein
MLSIMRFGLVWFGFLLFELLAWMECGLPWLVAFAMSFMMNDE